jgi:hypothetical protein
MSQVLTLKLNDTIFTAIQQQAKAMGTSPELLSANLLEQQFEQVFKKPLDKTERELAKKRFENHFGKLNLDGEIDINNESIDSDLVREYANNHGDT